MSRSYRYFPTLLLAAGVALAAPACADQIYGSGYPRGGGVYNRDLDRRAYDNGFREGVEEGQNDARHNRDFSYQRHDEYRDADDGYRRHDGDRDVYRRSYRQGFQAGYSESYNRNARYSRDGRDRRDGRDEGRYERGGIYPPAATYPGYPPASNRGYGGSVAAQNGYRDGLDAGRNDARDRERFDPVRAKRYREGDHDYDNRYGSREEYKRDYRAAFEQGYREGYGRR